MWPVVKERFIRVKRAGMWGEVERVGGWKRWVVVLRGRWGCLLGGVMVVEVASVKGVVWRNGVVEAIVEE